MHTLTIRRPDDFHVHFRQSEMLAKIAKYTSRHFARALVMPNTDPPILTGEDAKRYRQEIRKATGNDFDPLIAIKLLETTTAQDIRSAFEVGVKAGKIYPRGVTTNSNDGVADISRLHDALYAMEELGMRLCIHPEHPDVFCLDREKAYLDVIEGIISKFPALEVVVEHASTAAAVEFVESLNSPIVAATITVHHLVLTLDDVVGGMLKPHHFCKPIAKREEDRAALVKAATSGAKCFFLGTDSAPHLRRNKECPSGCAGVFTAPVALPVLAEVFEAQGKLHFLENFTSTFGARFYGLPPNEGTITLCRERWTVPGEYDGVVPFKAGEKLSWKVQN